MERQCFRLKPFGYVQTTADISGEVAFYAIKWNAAIENPVVCSVVSPQAILSLEYFSFLECQ